MIALSILLASIIIGFPILCVAISLGAFAKNFREKQPQPNNVYLVVPSSAGNEESSLNVEGVH